MPGGRTAAGSVVVPRGIVKYSTGRGTAAKNAVLRVIAVSLTCTALAMAAVPSSSNEKPPCRTSEPKAMDQQAKKDAATAAKRPNRLIGSKSPYLLQHADNPVDWFPWGPEAFEKATREDKPIFLSIGYSTCHWCHVMEHESFEDEEVAKAMNDAWVSIKVDREERPDIDHLYMTVCQAMTGSGGWPLNILMTPDRKPFFAATYIPKDSRHGRMGIVDLARGIQGAWKTRRAELTAAGDRMVEVLEDASRARPGEALDESILKPAYREFAGQFDERHGGFGGAPKFPTPHHLAFLLRYWKRTGEAGALDMVERTLQAMRRGGLWDHVGFGFHRYSTDARWLVPHFEKMLYDQALLVMAFTEAFQATRRDEYHETACEVLTYILRDMTSCEGGFYSAEDADSEGMEGKFYVWTEEELRKVLDGEEADLAVQLFAVREDGNFAEEASSGRRDTNILHLEKPLAQTAAEMKLPGDDLRRRLESVRRKLFAARDSRVRPHRDDKILTDWNGLMIASLAHASGVFDEPEYSRAASRAADFLLGTMRRPDGRLLHRYRNGEAEIPGFADDYAFLIWGLLELYESTFDVRHLEQALALKDLLLKHFWDNKAGGFFHTADDAEKLLVRRKESIDGAVPSGNSVAAMDLIRLARITGDPELEARAVVIGRTFSEGVKATPTSFTHLLLAVDFEAGPSHEVVIAGRPEAEDTQAMLRALNTHFLPNVVVLLRAEGPSPPIVQVAPFTEAQRSIEGRATAYVCRDFACKAPTTDVRKMLELLREAP